MIKEREEGRKLIDESEAFFSLGARSVHQQYSLLSILRVARESERGLG